MLQWTKRLKLPFGRASAVKQAPVSAAANDDAPGVEAVLERLEWTVLKRLDGLLQGDYRTVLRGFGLDLADLREYQPHDDVRHIDWNATARLQTPYVRTFHEDREIAAWFLIDLSGSMDFGSVVRRKGELALELAGVLARMLTRRGNRVGAVLLANQRAPVVIPAAHGRRQVLNLLAAIRRAGHTGHGGHSGNAKVNSSSQEPGSLTDLGALLAQADNAIKRRAAVFVLSDFISAPGWEDPLARLARRHEVTAIRLHDPVESQLPELGMLTMTDAETGEQILIDTQDRAFRTRFVEAAAAHEAALTASFKTSGVECVSIATDQALHLELLKFVSLRRQRLRQGVR
jgi:uncharacterized protein (DUF58 family)